MTILHSHEGVVNGLSKSYLLGNFYLNFKHLSLDFFMQDILDSRSFWEATP